MKVLAYIVTILLFQLPFTDTMGQVNKVYDKEEKNLANYLHIKEVHHPHQQC